VKKFQIKKKHFNDKFNSLKQLVSNLNFKGAHNNAERTEADC
jgi:hypothetical protein